MIPALGPNTLKVLVVPIFPDPNFLISLLKKTFPIITPVGNDPIKYAKIINDIVFNIDII